MKKAREDKLLVKELQQGNKDALRRIYMMYKNDMLALARILLNDAITAEDVVHDAFVSFAESAKNIKIKKSLKAYLATCVTNEIRNNKRNVPLHLVGLDEAWILNSGVDDPALTAEKKEDLKRIADALSQLPYEQREVIILRYQAELTYKEIAKVQNVEINTIKSRYRYGIDKISSQLGCEKLEL